jgi:uncharacterized membrane protein
MSRSFEPALRARLVDAELVQGEIPELGDNATPWYVRLMLGIAGWIGAGFLLGLVGVGFEFVFKSETAALVIGGLLCTAAAVLFRARQESDFTSQFGLAVSFAGQALILVGLLRLFGQEPRVVAGVVMVVQVLLFVVAPNFLHRVWSVAAGGFAVIYVLNRSGLVAFSKVILLAAIAWIWLREFRVAVRAEAMRALGYGLVLLLLFLYVGYWGFGVSTGVWYFGAVKPPLGGQVGAWIALLLTGAVLVACVWTLLRREGVAVASQSGGAALAGAVVLALVSLKVPGIALTGTVLLLGFAHANRVLAGLGAAGLLLCLGFYYYALNLTLLEKSWLLMGSGVLLLVGRTGALVAARGGGPCVS